MKILTNGHVVLSASDMTAASECEWAFIRKLDQGLGHQIEVPEGQDPMREKAGELGNVHELKLLQGYREMYPGDVAEIERPRPAHTDAEFSQALEERNNETLEALERGVKVVFQATFFDGGFQGFADFLIKNDDGEYEVFDAKLARKAKVTALLQLAAYADQLRTHGIAVGSTAYLILGDGTVSPHKLTDIMPVYLKRREYLRRIVEDRREAKARGDQAVEWGDEAFAICGRCAACQQKVREHDDLLLVADMRMVQRAKLQAAGISTLTKLAQTQGPVEGMAEDTLRSLRAQASAQLATTNLPEGSTPFYAVDRPDALDVIPAPSPGDIFFDFEGDPMYEERGIWNIDYLFGLVDAQSVFQGFWAHNIAQEKTALVDFMKYVANKRERYPDMHIYHYAAYEQTHLLQLAQRHGVVEKEVDQLVREHVLVNLYPILKRSIRVGSPSYSLKKIEKIYDPLAHTGDGVVNAADSIVEYNLYRDLVASGNTADAELKLRDLENYNKEDCISTLKLRDWLLAERQGPGRKAVVELPFEEDKVDEADALEELLAGLIADVPVSERTPNDQAVALALAALRYHSRELRSFWWEHYHRLSAPLDTWEDQRDVLVATSVQVISDWHAEPRSTKRVIEVSGRFAPGSNIRVGGAPFVIYDPPPPGLLDITDPAPRGTHNKTKVLEVFEGGALLEERISKGEIPWEMVPMAAAPTAPPMTKDIRARIIEWAGTIATTLPDIPQDPAYDILRRATPNGILTHPGEGVSPAEAITASLRAINGSYLAVQGPPGAGKTHNAAQVITTLATRLGWKIGVVAQSHATIENLLNAVVNAGMDPTRIGKKSRAGDNEEKPWSELGTGEITADFVGQLGGCVVGGTVWNFASKKAFGAKDLDLLVIDEAGQFSLANTIAASTVAKNLLLLGDPQQLPQVSQGSHPEPVDQSALGWLSEGHDVLPREFGVFLDTSWRMHEAVCQSVSVLSYDGKLTSHPSDRHLGGVDPGVHPIQVEHTGNSVESREEARAVVKLVADLINKPWTTGGQTRPLGQCEKNIIVVAPYNAQVNLIAHELEQAGFGDIPVGTVDKFQGQEAAIAIVSMSASSVEDVPRGIDFLLMRNRLNVALSRAQWAAYVFYSPHLSNFLPRTPANLALLSGFINLVEPNKATV